MTETEQSPPQSAAAATSTATDSTTNYFKISFSIWPPTERTRDAVRNRLIETLSNPSVLSKRYDTVSREEAVEAAKRIEEAAYEAAGQAADTGDDGIEMLQVYTKEISKRMMDTLKASSDRSVASETPAVDETSVKAEEEEDVGSTAPPQSENVDSVADDE